MQEKFSMPKLKKLKSADLIILMKEHFTIYGRARRILRERKELTHPVKSEIDDYRIVKTLAHSFSFQECAKQLNQYLSGSTLNRYKKLKHRHAVPFITEKYNLVVEGDRCRLNVKDDLGKTKSYAAKSVDELIAKANITVPKEIEYLTNVRLQKLYGNKYFVPNNGLNISKTETQKAVKDAPKVLSNVKTKASMAAINKAVTPAIPAKTTKGAKKQILTTKPKAAKLPKEVKTLKTAELPKAEKKQTIAVKLKGAKALKLPKEVKNLKAVKPPKAEKKQTIAVKLKGAKALKLPKEVKNLKTAKLPKVEKKQTIAVKLKGAKALKLPKEVKTKISKVAQKPVVTEAKKVSKTVKIVAIDKNVKLPKAGIKPNAELKVKKADKKPLETQQKGKPEVAKTSKGKKTVKATFKPSEILDKQVNAKTEAPKQARTRTIVSSVKIPLKPSNKTVKSHSPEKKSNAGMKKKVYKSN